MKLLTHFGKNSTERIENALNELRSGKGILLIDDADRENEGDIIFSAEKIKISDMALMIRECSGIVCLCLTQEKCESLKLNPMVKNNQSKNKTAFTNSIEARNGVTTGVSAKDRITTIKTAITTKNADDIVSPGHVFPLIAQNNGVFERRGHTEGSIDLMKLAGLNACSVLCELTNIDGTMAKTNEIFNFAEKNKMTVVTIDDIYNYRKQNEL
jgi:3,4-dihydroxy 2-butanone 4-phosphate synthase